MHEPERWGICYMAFEPSQMIHGGYRTVERPLLEAVMICYYSQKKFHEERDVYANKVKYLDLPEEAPYPGIEWPPDIVWMRGGYQMIVYDKDARMGLRVREDGQLKIMPYHKTWALEYMQGTRPSPNDN